MTTGTAVIKNSDMEIHMEKDVINLSSIAFQKFSVEKDIAAYIKKQLDKKYGSSWHCIVGKSFGSYVTHQTSHFIYFYLDKFAILLFKSA